MCSYYIRHVAVSHQFNNEYTDVSNAKSFLPMMHRDGYGDRNGNGSGDGKQENLKIMDTGTANIY